VDIIKNLKTEKIKNCKNKARERVGITYSSKSVKKHVLGVFQKFPKYINENYYILSGSYSAPSPSK
jgi:hypothetical protein